MIIQNPCECPAHVLVLPDSLNHDVLKQNSNPQSILLCVSINGLPRHYKDDLYAFLWR